MAYMEQAVNLTVQTCVRLPMIRGIDYVSVPVEDFASSVRFYRDVVGLSLAYAIPDRWAEFDAGNTRLSVYPREEDEGRGGDVGLLVDDLLTEMARLEASGVSFPHGVERFDLPSGRGRLARFRDPSGNRLELLEREGPSLPHS